MEHLPLYRYRVTEITKMYDGDTIRCNVDLGFGIILRGIDGDGQSFRLHGLNAPEVRGDEREDGLKSRDALREKMKNAERIEIKSMINQQDKYGRYVAEFFILEDGEWINVNDWLVENGHAERVEY